MAEQDQEAEPAPPYIAYQVPGQLLRARDQFQTARKRQSPSAPYERGSWSDREGNRQR